MVPAANFVEKFNASCGRMDGHTDICPVLDSESICIREGGSRSLR